MHRKDRFRTDTVWMKILRSIQRAIQHDPASVSFRSKQNNPKKFSTHRMERHADNETERQRDNETERPKGTERVNRMRATYDQILQRMAEWVLIRVQLSHPARGSGMIDVFQLYLLRSILV
eukprot:COSAG06_NODE_17137_length_959_cov_1.244186_1_plen_121_part_00